MGVVEEWQRIALEKEGYTERPVYAAILSILRDRKGGQFELILSGNNPALKENRLTDEDFVLLLQALPGQTTSWLDFSYNHLTDSSMVDLAEHIKTVGCCLEHINLQYNNITPSGVQILADALQVNASVKTLILDGNNLEKKGGVQLASMLQVNTTLTKLSMAHTDLHTDSVIAMATVLHGNKSISSMDMSRPLLHSHMEETTIHISKMLKINYTLQELHLSKHGMTDTGVKWICQFLKSNTGLIQLDLSCNKLSRDGAESIADLLSCNTALQSIDISSNRIENEGLIFISKALSSANTNLKSLTVCHNEIRDEGLCALANVLLTSNSTLTNVYIWGNNWSTPTCDAFKQLLATERVMVSSTDVRDYIVDGITYLARTTVVSY